MTISKVTTIATTLNQASGENIITVVDNVNFYAPAIGEQIAAVNCFVKNLRAMAVIKSLPEAELPPITIEMTQQEKIAATLEIEWNSPRKQLDLYIGDSQTWNLVGSISLLNPAGYPYRMYNVMDLYTDNLAIELGQNGRVGIAIRNVGSGALTSDDFVTIHGSYVQEIITVPISSRNTQAIATTAAYANTNTYSLGENILLNITSDSGRVGISFQNNGSTDIYVNAGGTASANAYTAMLQPGDLFEPLFQQYTGEYTVISPAAGGEIIISEYTNTAPA